MPRVITGELVTFLRQRFALDWRGIHGAGHWSRVRRNALLLAEKTNADRTVVELFAVTHDLCRQNDGRDTDHGARAAELVLEIQRDVLGVSREQADLLAYACEHHSRGNNEADITVQVCWDADRLDLGRIGIRPDPRYLCTAAARESSVIEWAYGRSLSRHARRRDAAD